MPTPTIPAGNLFMNATLWTGNGVSGRAITNGVAGQSFQPDLVWVKSRSAAYDGLILDAVRGSGKSLTPSSTAAEVTNNINGYVSAFNSDGFTLTQGSSSIVSVNETSTTYVGWNWKAGGTAVTNTSGTISSQVSANTTSGFSVVTYTGTGSAGTVGHGLGVAPSMVIIKNRTAAATAWNVYQSSIPSNNLLSLNSTVASFANTNRITAVSATTFSIGTDSDVNGSTNSHVAYCWTPIAGYSAFGSYTGNASTDGPFVYLGFRPRFIMFKRTDSTGDWTMVDTSRNTYNVMTYRLYANLSNAEDTDTPCDSLSNGFKIRTTAATVNASSGTFIYMAFAENPFKYANAR